MPKLLFLLLAACSGSQTGKIYDYTLTITPVTPDNQSPFDGLVSLDLVIEPEVGEELVYSLDADALAASGDPEITDLPALDNATLALEGYDDARMFSFGRSDPVSLETGTADVRMLVAETDRFAWFNSLETPNFGGAMASDGQGRFLLFGGNTGGVGTNTEEDVVDTVWAMDVAPPDEAFTLEAVGTMPVDADGEGRRVGHSASTLYNSDAAGLVLVAAGQKTYFQGQTSRADAFVWDPEEQEVSSEITLKKKRYFHQAVENQAGKVLLIGGFGYARAGVIALEPSIEIVDPVTGESELAVGNTEAGFVWTSAASLGSEGVLFCGGVAEEASGWTGTAACDLVSNSGEVQGGYITLDEPLSNASLVQLGDGKALLTGGLVTTGVADMNDFVEVPATDRAWIIEGGQIREVGSMHLARAAHGSALLPDGRVLVFGGMTATPSGLYPAADYALACAEVFDPSDEQFYVLESCSEDSTSSPLPEQTSFPSYFADPLYGLLTASGIAPSGRTYGDATSGVSYFVSCPDPDQC